MSRYAAGTEVPVERSKGQIEKMLMDYGATHFSYHVGPVGAVVSFQIEARVVRLKIGLPQPAQFAKDGNGRLRTPIQVRDLVDRAARQAWRILLLVIKAKLEAVETGISTIEEEFLAWVVAENGQTVGDILAPQLAGRQPLQLTAGR